MRFSGSRSSRDYGAAERLLHRLLLGSRAVMETTFDVERALYSGRLDPAWLERPVFVCGLARGGTSLVTRLLDGTGEFASLRYRDMPAPLAPNLWARLSSGNSRRVVGEQRGHGDGLSHDLDTPEAIEEVFWRAFEGDRYIRPDHLKDARPEEETLAAYKTLIGLCALREGRGRYLAKNNNHVLRLGALAKAFPDVIFVHPFRAPSDHAASLLRQHLQACGRHREDDFSRRYARWLAHHEFGLDHRPLSFSKEGAVRDPMKIAYWQTYWEVVHAHLLGQPPEVAARQIFLDVDALRCGPADVLASLSRKVGCASLDPGIVFQSGLVREAESDIHAALVTRARASVV